MKLVVISPEAADPRENEVMAALFEAGLERYHVRKPRVSLDRLRAWLGEVPEKWRSRLVLHQHHGLAAEFGCGGVHWRDASSLAGDDAPFFPERLGNHFPRLFTSRSCHDLATLRKSLGHYDSVFFSPVFPSISKSGYQPRIGDDELSIVLHRRSAEERQTLVVALGGVVPENAAHCAELGFDGVAVLGSIWQAGDPVAVFRELKMAVTVYAT